MILGKDNKARKVGRDWWGGKRMLVGDRNVQPLIILMILCMRASTHAHTHTHTYMHAHTCQNLSDYTLRHMYLVGVNYPAVKLFKNNLPLSILLDCHFQKLMLD